MQVESEESQKLFSTEILRIGELAKTKDVYLVCFERMGNYHRLLLVDMIKRGHDH